MAFDAACPATHAGRGQPAFLMSCRREASSWHMDPAGQQAMYEKFRLGLAQLQLDFERQLVDIGGLLTNRIGQVDRLAGLV